MTILISFLGGDPFEEFSLDPKTGVLTTKVAFQDRLSGSRMLFVEAKDGGYPDALSDIAKVSRIFLVKPKI